jgi:adenosyl cobinamide kinase/adenosyl cobinamide phosphate guanylyltransferase
MQQHLEERKKNRKQDEMIMIEGLNKMVAVMTKREERERERERERETATKCKSHGRRPI